MFDVKPYTSSVRVKKKKNICIRVLWEYLQGVPVPVTSFGYKHSAQTQLVVVVC